MSFFVNPLSDLAQHFWVPPPKERRTTPCPRLSSLSLPHRRWIALETFLLSLWCLPENSWSWLAENLLDECKQTSSSTCCLGCSGTCRLVWTSIPSLPSFLQLTQSQNSGKSTLCGRMLFECGARSTEEFKKIQQLATGMGKGSFSYAYLVNHLPAERERGISMLTFKFFCLPTRCLTNSFKSDWWACCILSKDWLFCRPH